MAEQDESSVHAEKEAILDDAMPKKRKWRLHLALVVVLGSGTWAFWTYSPMALQFKHNIFGAAEVASLVDTNQQAINLDNTISSSLANMPLFENHTMLHEVEVDVEQPVAVPDAYGIAPEDEQGSDAAIQQFAAQQLAVQQLQAEVHKLNQNMISLQNQQVQQMQMQVRGQLFQFLAKAAAKRSSMQSMNLAWKSITLLPMLSDEKRDYALQAYQALSLLLEDKDQAQSELVQLLEEVSGQQDGDESQVVALSGVAVEQPLPASSWSDWLSAQFSLRKVMQDSENGAKQGEPSDEDKLIALILRSKQHLDSEQWSRLSAIDVLVYKLNQQGLETTISAEVLARLQQGKQDWQQQAQAWMEQL